MESVRVYKTESSVYARTRQRDEQGKLIKESWTKNGEPIGATAYVPKKVVAKALQERDKYDSPKQLIGILKKYKCTVIGGHIIYEDFIKGKLMASNAIITIDEKNPFLKQQSLNEVIENSNLIKIAENQD